jgi:dienelactone hydrolase
MPEKTPLHASVTGIIQQEGYEIEKVVYQSFANHHVTANLYIPSGKGPFPAALLFCGHEDAGKATASYQQTAILFAKNGFVVFVIDPISQSERYQVVDEKGKPLTRGGTTEHTLLNEACNLFGNSVPGYELLDNVRGLDFLVTRPEVDTTRIGCLGNSGGGMQTIYFAGYDQRVKIFAPCSYLDNRERVLEMSGPADGCAQIPGEGKMQLELDDYLIAAAPKPLLVLAGRYDFIDYNGTSIAYKELEKVYDLFGQSKKLQLFTYDDGHGISQPKREAAVTWFRKWFYNDDKPVKETGFREYGDSALFATASGNINTDFVNEFSITKRNLEQFNATSARRANFISQDKKQVKQKIRELLSVANFSGNVADEEKPAEIINDIAFHKEIFRLNDEIPLPVLIVYSPFGTKKIVIWVNDQGKKKIADSAALMHEYQQQECITLIADTRGTGETADKPELNDPKYFNKEYRNAMLSLHISKPLVGQRVSDILILLQAIENNAAYNGIPIELNATGVNCLPALHAAVLDSRITRLNLYNSISSFKTILEKPAEKNWYSYVIPGVLNFYDIPDLVNLIGRDKVNFIQQ